MIETNESRRVFRRHVEHRTPIFGHDPPWGEVYTCPRCDWQSRGMKYRLGAEWEGEKHSLVCPLFFLLHPYSRERARRTSRTAMTPAGAEISTRTTGKSSRRP